VLIDDVVWLEVDHVDAAHAEAMAHGAAGEDPGKLDAGLVESAVMAPRNGYPDTLAEIAANYVFGVAKNHGYQNSNKCTAAIVLVMFLEMNNIQVVLADEWVNIIEDVAKSKITKHRLIDIIVSRLLGGLDVPIEY
jgi:death-on-curing protein